MRSVSVQQFREQKRYENTVGITRRITVGHGELQQLVRVPHLLSNAEPRVAHIPNLEILGTKSA